MEDFIEAGAADITKRFASIFRPTNAGAFLTPSALREMGVACGPWWTLPWTDCDALANMLSPAHMAETCARHGVAESLVLPTYGLISLFVDDEDARLEIVSAFNRYSNAIYDSHTSLTPVGLVPMHTPAEAISELEHCVEKLHMETVILPAYVRRYTQDSKSYWYDNFGVDTLHDYSPFWRRAEDLDVSLGFHTTGIGVGLRSSSSYVFNHCGAFSGANAAVLKSLILSGVPIRFPKLRFGFFEGSVSWFVHTIRQLADRFELRNSRAMKKYDPRLMDSEVIHNIIQSDRFFCANNITSDMDLAHLNLLVNRADGTHFVDEWNESGVFDIDDLDSVVGHCYVSCGVDDYHMLNRSDTDTQPNLMFGSDFGHWDGYDLRNLQHEPILADSDLESIQCFFERSYDRYLGRE